MYKEKMDPVKPAVASVIAPGPLDSWRGRRRGKRA
jgi:hypothetical protein